MTARTISFAGYTFDADKGCFTCKHVMDGASVLLFVHEPDGDLQFLCGASDHDFAEQCKFLHAVHVLEWHPDLLSLPTVNVGFEAERRDAISPWVVTPSLPYE